jgi:hypothetical protein
LLLAGVPHEGARAHAARMTLGTHQAAAVDARAAAGAGHQATFSVGARQSTVAAHIALIAGTHGEAVAGGEGARAVAGARAADDAGGGIGTDDARAGQLTLRAEVQRVAGALGRALRVQSTGAWCRRESVSAYVAVCSAASIGMSVR